MKTNLNILKVGAIVDTFILDHKERLNNKIYFEGAGLQFKFKIEGQDGNHATFSIPELDDDMLKIIEFNNPDFIHDKKEKLTFGLWCKKLLLPNSTHGNKIGNQKLGWIKYKIDDTTFKSLTSADKLAQLLEGLGVEESKVGEDKPKAQTKKNKEKPSKKTTRKVKSKKVKEKKYKKLPEADLMNKMKEYLKNGTEFIDKHNKNYNDYLKYMETKNREEADKEDDMLYPLLEDEDFNKKIWQKKEFKSGNEYPERSQKEINEIDITTKKICDNLEFELLPHQKFIKNFLSFQTPYNSLLIYHGLGTGKTCSSIGVAEEYRTYANQMGINKKIIVVASDFVQKNYQKQLFDENKLKNIGGLWNLKSCTGNKFLKEINPMSMKNLSKEHVVKQIKKIIKENYEFMAYLEFARQIEKEIKKVTLNDGESEASRKTKIQAVRDEYSDRLIIIDEVHNIRDKDADNNKKDTKLLKSTTDHFKTLVTYADNLKLLLLTGTPMYNEYSEIIWLLNLMNLNDNRYSIEESDIFDSEGNITDTGKEILIQKARGYVSFVQGEDPFMFPFRVYPKEDDFSYNQNSLKLLSEGNHNFYPVKQLNGFTIPTFDGKRGIKYLDIFMTKMGDKQKEIYEKYIDYMVKDEKSVRETQERFNYKVLLSPSQMLNICYPTEEREWKYKFGSNGLKEVMKPYSSLSEFEYKENHKGFFKEENLKEYSGKITKIIKEVIKSKGIILIYSQYIEGGCIPIALALEEAGYSKLGGSLFKNKITGENRGNYIMITGHRELNRNFIQSLNICNSKENRNGDKIKVVIISRAGSEGLDFANIRQVHIMDPWYNLNRTGQIEGRAIRNQSHCNLDFKDRNVLIFLHGTHGLTDNIEAADMYLYRVAEEKAELSGKVSRILKETSIDCALNTNMKKLSKEVLKLKKQIELSNGSEIKFDIGHSDNGQICDFMNCNYECAPAIGSDWKENAYTYNDRFMTLTVTKIMEIIKRLFKEKYVYDKEDLIKHINMIRTYKRDEIFNALSILINDKTEYIEDNLERKGRLINIADLYLFQPIELSYKPLSVHQRRQPLPYKPPTIIIPLNPLEKEEIMGDHFIDDLLEKLEFCFDDKKFINIYTAWNEDSEDKNFNKKYHYHIPNIIHILHKHLDFDLNILKQLAAFKVIDNMKDNFNTKLFLLNNYKKDKMYKEKYKHYKEQIKKAVDLYFKRYQFMDEKYCMITNFKHEGTHNSKGKVSIVEKVGSVYKPIEEYKEESYLQKYIKEKDIQIIQSDINEFIGFSTYFDDARKDDIVFKYKTIGTRVNKGVICNNMPKRDDLIIIINNLLKNDFHNEEVPIAEILKKGQFGSSSDKYKGFNKIGGLHMCLFIEFILKYFEHIEHKNKKWFFMTTESILYGVEYLPNLKTMYQKHSFKKA